MQILLNLLSLLRLNTRNRAQQMVWCDTCQQACGRVGSPAVEQLSALRPPRFVWSGEVVSKECLCCLCRATVSCTILWQVGGWQIKTNRIKTLVKWRLWLELVTTVIFYCVNLFHEAGLSLRLSTLSRVKHRCVCFPLCNQGLTKQESKTYWQLLSYSCKLAGRWHCQ